VNDLTAEKAALQLKIAALNAELARKTAALDDATS